MHAFILLRFIFSLIITIKEFPDFDTYSAKNLELEQVSASAPRVGDHITEEISMNPKRKALMKNIFPQKITKVVIIKWKYNLFANYTFLKVGKGELNTFQCQILCIVKGNSFLDKIKKYKHKKSKVGKIN